METMTQDRAVQEVATTATLTQRIITQRKIEGISAILLPFTESGEIDFDGFTRHVARTANAGLAPAVNMDTGYVNLLDDATRQEVLRQTQATLAGRPFVAGAFVPSKPGDDWHDDGVYEAVAEQMALIQHYGGTPVVFQSFSLTALAPDQMLEAYAALGRDCPRFIGFELGTMFAPFGKIYDLETYRGLLQIPQCIGAKHSSLNRSLEWQRLALRDRVRPDFKVYTGNDLAIDMVIYGSDYLLGISTFAPEAFAVRDALWAAGDERFYELNDLLQYLGFFAFRPPVPAYKHSAAQFLKIRGRIASDTPHVLAERRPTSDVAILRDISDRLDAMLAGISDG